jgi:glucose/arabinose dehydrogenase
VNDEGVKVPSDILPRRRSKRMRRLTSVLVLTATLVALSPLAAAPASARIARRAVIRCNGCWPTALAFIPSGGRMFYVERFTGQIHSYNMETGRNWLWGRITGLGTSGEQGLLGIAVDPRWPSVRRLYVYFTNGSPLENRIARLQWDSDGTPIRDRLATIPAAGNHNGGVIHVGPDGYLYAVTGDAGDPARSQDTAGNSGKVLRMTLRGGVPANNPFPGEFAFSYGHRNSFGFTWDPRTGRLWQTENGDDCDEVNLVRRGLDYGWGPPGDVAPCPDTRGEDPETSWGPDGSDIAPTGATFCRGCDLRARSQLLVGSWNDGRIRRLPLDADRNDIVARRLVYDNPLGVLALESRPNGRVYFSDSNGIYRLVRL